MTEIAPQAIPDVLLITPRRFADERGFFMETYSAPSLAEAGFREVFVQDNHSMSAAKGTVRGLHFQAPPHAQAKLLRVIRGVIFDVAVDIRTGSATYGRYVAAELGADNGRQLLIPAGFAHGFQTLTENTEVLYKVTAPYAPASEGGLKWNDPTLGIRWPIGDDRSIINARDTAWPGLAAFKSPF